jgi:hypothetical protein
MVRRCFVGSALFLLLAFCVSLDAPAQVAKEEGYSHIRVIRLSFVEGQVFLTRAGENEPRKALLNYPVEHGAVLSTAEGITEMELESGVLVHLAENSRLDMTELGLRQNGGRVTELNLDKGTASFYAKLGKRDTFEVNTPQVQVSVPKQARFRVDVYDNESTVTVRKGKVNVKARGGLVTLSKGESAVVRGEEKGAVEVAQAALAAGQGRARDAWDRWSEGRYERTEVAASSAYLPADMRYGARALDLWGLWFFYPGYGYVWQPYAAAGWSPFFYGLWDWVPGLGYTWVSFEPWGWLPYHYGRWMLTPYGWAWVPGYFDWFSPGTVVWMNCGNYVGWAPQQPGTVPPPAASPGGTLPPGTVVNTPGGVARGGPNKVPKDVAGLDSAHATFINRLERSQEMRELATQSLAGQSALAAAAPQPSGGTPRFLFNPKERRFISNPKAREREASATREMATERARGLLVEPGLLKATGERGSGVKMSPLRGTSPRAPTGRDVDRGEASARPTAPRTGPSAAPRPSAEPRYAPPPTAPPAPRPAPPSGGQRPSSPPPHR